MRVEHLIIWQEENEAESNAGAEGLYDRHLHKCDFVEWWKGHPPTQYAGENGAPSAEVSPGIGFYAVFHNIGWFNNTGLNLVIPTGTSFIEKVLRPILGDALPNLTKLVFVACAMAPGETQIAQFSGGQNVEEITQQQNSPLGNQSYMIDVMLKLNALEIRPEIVGWDNFISVLPAAPGNNRSVYNSTLQKKLTPGQMAGEMYGKKYVMHPRGNGMKFGLVSPDYREAHKRTFAITDSGHVRITGPGGWSEDI